MKTEHCVQNCEKETFLTGIDLYCTVAALEVYNWQFAKRLPVQ